MKNINSAEIYYLINFFKCWNDKNIIRLYTFLFEITNFESPKQSMFWDKNEEINEFHMKKWWFYYLLEAFSINILSRQDRLRLL